MSVVRFLIRFFLTILLLVHCILHSPAQVLQWAKAYGSVSPATVSNNSIAVDAAGNTFIAGQFTNTVDFDPGPGTLNVTGLSMGFPDIFIAKYDASGNFLWVKNISGANSEGSTAIACDAGGNIYITGFLSGPVDFDPGAGVQNVTSTTVGVYDIFLARYDNNGNYQWAFNLGGTGTDQGLSIAADASGIVVAGDFSSTADFDPSVSTVNLVSSGSTDAFFARYTFAGNFVWAKRIGGTGTDEAESICHDAVSNSYYVTGHFNATSDFDPGAATYNLVPAGGYDIYLAKYDAAGNFSWALMIGGTPTEDVYSVASDPLSGDAYITGSFSNTFDFDPSGSTFNLSGSVFGDIFLAKYNSSGNFSWAFKLGASSATDVGRCVFVDGFCNVYLSGRFSNTVDFDPGAGTQNRTSTGNADAFFAKYSSAGNYLFAGTFGNSSGSDQCRAVRSDGLNVFIAGSISGIADFDVSGATVNAGTSGVFSAFIAKYGASPLPVQLLSFSANLSDDNTVSIDWITASEKNNDYFSVERSSDNKTFSSIAEVKGAGNSSHANSYKAKDPAPLNGINYYRLKQTDFDGNFSYSKAAAVHLNKIFSATVFPNPFSETAVLTFDKNENEIAEIRMADVFGKEVLRTETASEFYIINRENLSPGIYFYMLSMRDKENYSGKTEPGKIVIW